MALSITKTHHDSAQNYAECCYADCNVLFIVMLRINLLMLKVTMLSFVMLNVVMLSVMVPIKRSLPNVKKLFSSVIYKCL
jgi:hypothetical protein